MIATEGPGASRATRPFVRRIARSVAAATWVSGVDRTTAHPAEARERSSESSLARSGLGRETGSSMRKTSAPETIARAMRAEAVPVGYRSRRGQGRQDVLADRQGFVEGGVGSDQGDRPDAPSETRGQRPGGCRDDAAGLGFLKAGQDQK